MGSAYFILGVIALLAGPLMLWVALPDKQGKTRSFLQAEAAQAVYSIAIIAVLVLGVGLVASELGMTIGMADIPAP